MKIMNISWNAGVDETKITLSDEFLESDRLVKLDVLGDILAMIEEIYTEAHEQKTNMPILKKKY